MTRHELQDHMEGILSMGSCQGQAAELANLWYDQTDGQLETLTTMFELLLLNNMFKQLGKELRESARRV